ncbi:MAG: hypothetical protein JSS49_20250 [Planctomycetes bacterium]|nr:hypothetical protein [Planctomycetota bacterium]
MKSRLLAGVALTVWIVAAGSAQATEPYLEFVRGLRERGYYDYAILYLDQIAARENTPAEIKQAIPYQKAMTLQESAKSARSPEKQMEQLNQAAAYLEQFVKENPNHPNAADANSDRAGILLSKAQAENLQAKSPSNQGSKRDYQNRARELVLKAREVYQTAFDQHEAAAKKYPAFIDQQKDPEQYAARAKVEQNLITASLSLGMCTYEEAQTYDSNAAEFKQLLNKAADEFEKMHQKYRSQVGGLYARAWQGKCYEEQRDLQKAIGIYNELLDHPGENASLSQLKTQTLYFKLICLNSKERHDYQLVVDLAEDWVKKHHNDLLTRLGLGIQWEQALALETLGDNPDLIKTEQERYWKLARTNALQIAKFPSEYKDSANSMATRVGAKLGKGEKAPDTFDVAFGLAQQSFSAAQDKKKELEDAAKAKVKRPTEDLTKLELDRLNDLNDAAQYFDLALSLAKPNDSKKDLATARLYYAYVNFWLRKNYEAAVLADFVARTVDKDEGTIGLDAAYIAMAAMVQAYNDNKAPNDQKTEDMRLITKASNLIAERWPQSDKANEALIMLGKLSKDPVEAAGYFGKIPESDPKYTEAQLSAGQAFWTAYLNSNRKVGPEKPTAEQLATWLQSAQDHLRRGIDKLTSVIPKEGASPPELIAAKMSLSQIMISVGKDPEALKLLLDDPHPVAKAVAVPDESKRPPTGVTSRKFAMETYKLILRAYIGTGNLDKARDTMKTLEAIAGAGGADGGAEVTELYVGLGRLLKDELERFRENNETERFNKLMTSFETFLNDMASRKDGQTFGTLSWIGETYFALGETVSAAGDAAKATSFYDKAGAAFGDILTKAKEDQTFASASQMYGVKLRQVRVLRLKKEFPPAETLITEILKENPNNLKVQIGAAELYQDWGSSGQADSVKKYMTAIYGNMKSGGNAWGWQQISMKLQKSPDFATNPVFVETFLEARYNGTLCRYQYAREQSAKDKQKELESCRTELAATTFITKDMSETEYARFNKLYRDVVQDAGQPVEDLPRATDIPLAPPEKEKKPEPVAVKKDEPKEVTPPPISAATWACLIGLVVIGLGAIVWAMTKGKAAPKAKAFGTELAGPVSFSGISMGDAPPPATFAPPKPKPRPAAAAAKPAAKPAAGATGTATPKPKPKPPTPPAAK